jgi:Fe-S-cluster containining protein
MNSQCEACQAKCCRYFCFQIDTPDSFEQYEHIRWFVLHEGVTVHVDKGDWYISIARPCREVSPEGRCQVYDQRPLICRKYSTGNCDYTSGDYEYEATFERPEDVEAYAMKAMGPEKFLKERDKALAKLAKRDQKRELRAARRDGEPA